MELVKFLKKQNSIYDDFRRNSVREKGTKPSSALNGQAGYIVALRHPNQITLPISNFTHELQKSTPGLVYDPNNVHTTILTYAVQEKENFELESSLIEKISKGVGKSLEIPWKSRIDFSEWLYNQDTVIIAGQPNKDFIDYSERIVEEINGKGLDVKMPWGAHITAFRFSQRQNPKELRDFFNIMEKCPNLGISVPQSVDIGYFTLIPEGFMLRTLERFSLY